MSRSFLFISGVFQIRIEDVNLVSFGGLNVYEPLTFQVATVAIKVYKFLKVWGKVVELFEVVLTSEFTYISEAPVVSSFV